MRTPPHFFASLALYVQRRFHYAHNVHANPPCVLFLGSCRQLGHASCCRGSFCQGSASNSAACFCDADCMSPYEDCCSDEPLDCGMVIAM